MKKILTFIAGILLLASCAVKPPVSDDVQISFLHLNDVYEISPLGNGQFGGLARVATLRKQLLAENPNTVTILAGDFLSPSVIGTLKHEGKRIQGKQMVETMNALGVDYVVFGNHEFDIKQEELQERLNESTFDWINTNAWEVSSSGNANFKKVQNGVATPLPRTVVREFDGIRLGLFGIVLPSNRKPFVAYDDFMESAQKAVAELASKTDVVIGITHINKADDRVLATKIPQVPLLMGGHDHDHMLERIGNTTLAKADANARTVYIHRVRVNRKTKQVSVTSELKAIDPQLAEEPTVKTIVDKWETIAKNSLESAGINKNNVIATLTEPFDGREASVRNGSTALTEALVKSVHSVFPSADVALFNGGSIRVDDVLQGPITELDVVRVLPFGGKVVSATMKGRLLEQVLQAGLKNRGNGGFLHWYNIAKQGEVFSVNGKLLDVNAIYTVAMPEYMLTGLETNLGFLNRKNPDVVSFEDTFQLPDPRADIRLAVINYFKK